MKIFSFLILFFMFNTLHIDSNSTKRLVYNPYDLYSLNYNTIYFVNTDSIELEEKLKSLDIEILSYIVEDEKYYARNIDILEEKYLKDKPLEKRIYYEINGIKIDGINVMCTNNELIKLDKMLDVY